MRDYARCIAVVLTFLPLPDRASAQLSYKRDGNEFDRIEVMSNGGAQCSLFRDSKLLGTTSVDADRKIGLSKSTITVDVTDSKSNILVVCKRGDAAISKTIQFKAEQWESTNAPTCKVWKDRTSPDDEPQCSLQEPSNSHWIEMQYPEIVRLYFEPPNPRQ